MDAKRYLITSLMLCLLVFTASALILAPEGWSIVYHTNIIQQEVMKETCIDAWGEANGTIHAEKCWEVVDYYIPQEITTGKVRGITDGNTIIENAYKVGNRLYIWDYDIGDRNFDEYGACRQYEIDKGVCSVI